MGVIIEDKIAETLEALFPAEVVFSTPVGDGPGIPDRVIFCIPTGGPQPTTWFGASTTYKYLRVQVRVRCDATEFSDGRALAQSVWDSLHLASIAGIKRARCQSAGPSYLSTDPNGRHEWSINVECEVVE